MATTLSRSARADSMEAGKNGSSHAAGRLPRPRLARIFAENVFSLRVMRELLPRAVFTEVSAAIRRGGRLGPKTAGAVAAAMKEWAIERGATHYTHWFQPLTGVTAEKHDSFLKPTPEGGAIEFFSGTQLGQAEPDASSFPSGGLRATFEARGYTAWDPSSPAFLMDNPGGATLCIPTIFVSYTGESLDTKTPLLRSIDALNRAALKVLELFKAKAVRVHSTIGPEQEYFLVDNSFYSKRPDLLLCGRTIFGSSPAKGQQLEDHYFGSIKERALGFMNEVERELYRLGVPLKTRHNEVAPNQFECAPIFEEANIAVDHNQLVMDVFRRAAARQGLSAVFHEKPFAGINGSGKHVNWSLATDSGENLLSPGHTPTDNLRFLVFLVCVIKAVHEHAALLRASIASSGNDHRLGANEAPPAIMSVFLGSSLTKALDDLERGVTTPGTEPEWMSFGIDRIPEILRDNTDRNRTSPFAFTGDKFEFRAVGSSFNCALPITVLHSIVADQLERAAALIRGRMARKTPFKEAVLGAVRDIYSSAKAVCFEGNNYSAEWEAEAARRGLPNVKTTPEALDGWDSPSSIALFKSLGVLSESETRSRAEIQRERYAKDIEIEARLHVEMAMTLCIPAAVKYLADLAKAAQAPGPAAEALKTLHKKISEETAAAVEGSRAIERALAKASAVPDARERSRAFCFEVRPLFEPLRSAVDSLESVLPDDFWPLPKYREMLFLI